MAEDAARELPNLPLEDALQLVYLYAERGSPKFEQAAMRWLERYPTLPRAGDGLSFIVATPVVRVLDLHLGAVEA